MKVRRLLGGAVIAAMALVPLAGTASASSARRGHTTKAQVIPIVRIDRHDPSVAHVIAVYRCTVADPVNDPGHLWVSVKQSESGRIDRSLQSEGSGFGGTAARWEDSHRNPITCDGRLRISEFTVDQVEGKSAYQTLKRGVAWVQFCLFDDTTPKGDGETDFGEPVSSNTWAFVL
jgi:hypothetical protein